MSTLWAIEVTPLNGRGKPWLEPNTMSRRRSDAWKKFAGESATPQWLAIINSRKDSGLLRAVKVTIQIAKEQK